MAERRNEAHVRCRCGERLATVSRDGRHLEPIPGSRIRLLAEERGVAVACQHCGAKRTFVNVTVDGIAVPDPGRPRAKMATN
jgi:hypothetical protein